MTTRMQTRSQSRKNQAKDASMPTYSTLVQGNLTGIVLAAKECSKFYLLEDETHFSGSLDGVEKPESRRKTSEQCNKVLVDSFRF